MDQSTHDVRRANWLNIITGCQQRPAGVSAKQWLADNGVKEKAYYYWLRKLRREACEQIQFPAVTAPPEMLHICIQCFKLYKLYPGDFVCK